jgi:helicase MOV-10
VLVRAQGSSEGRWFEGVVHVVHDAEVGLRFSRSFDYAPTRRFDIQFAFNRYPLRRQHQALNSAFREDRVLFPRTDHISPLKPKPDHIVWFNTDIGNNSHQASAVETILRLPEGAHPFIIFGP